MQNILDVINEPGSTPTLVPGDSGINVTEISDKHYLVTNYAQGVAGPQGPAGATGAPGPSGGPGGIGDTGLIGPVGPPGPGRGIGPAGPPGIDGVDGQDGGIGPAGPPGPSGQDGIHGEDGQDGGVGPVGPQGVQEETGSQGVSCAVQVVTCNGTSYTAEDISEFAFIGAAWVSAGGVLSISGLKRATGAPGAQGIPG